MAQFATYVNSKGIGEIDDRVRLFVGDEEAVICETYSVHVSVFNQPARWTVQLGSADTCSALLKMFKPGRTFRLKIGDVLQQTGTLENQGAKTRGGTAVTISGRDQLAPLHDDHISDERTFKDDTFLSLARKQLDAVGLQNHPLVGSNRANRKIRAGVPLVELAPPRDVTQILTEATGAPGISHMEILARLNERRYEFLNRYLQLAGLFMWAGADGSFILSEPNAKQEPISSIIRRPGQSRQETNVIDDDFNFRTEHRFSEYSFYAKGVGRKNAHAKALGVFVDDEMTNLGFVKKKVARSQNARTKAQAEFLARRAAAEDRRSGWTLSYTVSGHSTSSNKTGESCVWTPDTVVHVDDQILGILGDFYLGEVEYRRSPETTTRLTLFRKEDLVYGPGEF